MKDSVTFEEQTEQIVHVLLSNLPGQTPRTEYCGLDLQLQGGGIVRDTGQTPRTECRGLDLQLQGGIVRDTATSSAASPFDPSHIANTLQRLGDEFNEDLERSAQEVIAQRNEETVVKFKETVATLSKTWSRQNPELEYERAFLAVAVKLFTYLARKAHYIAQSHLLTETINGTPQVRQYIERQGGWEYFGNRRG
ncbi:bcl-2-like protein 15 [Rhineura floridana]|uniref:bcl-2-like protein 15 n=1 Tax=Rhineura floridana TaxID=261503 RepID=UPI002AC7F92B|nr:bcl-2-like protein 15 [Rhineura floridana]